MLSSQHSALSSQHSALSTQQTQQTQQNRDATLSPVLYSRSFRKSLITEDAEARSEPAPSHYLRNWLSAEC